MQEARRVLAALQAQYSRGPGKRGAWELGSLGKGGAWGENFGNTWREVEPMAEKENNRLEIKKSNF